ncbi:MAG: nicotinate-nucleotide adenylyltransferase [Gemmatimonadota bacterium]
MGRRTRAAESDDPPRGGSTGGGTTGDGAEGRGSDADRGPRAGRGPHAGRDADPGGERIGVFGGTFDPPHRGHVTVARDVADALSLHRVLWIPAATSPFKVGETETPAALRLEMVRAAAEADPRFQADDEEIRRGGVSYTVDTLRALRARWPGARLFLILGADQVKELPGWKEPEEVLRLAVPAVMDREGFSALEVAPDLPGMERAVAVPVTRVDVSSTLVRERAAAGEDIADLVPPGVLEIIRREGLYGVGGA